MELNKDNIKKIMLLIVFTICVFVGIQNMDVLWHAVKIFINMLSPFILGAAIAFVLNLPMRFIENKIFHVQDQKAKKKKIIRILSLVLAIIFVVCTIVIVLFVVIPQLGDTFVVLGNDIREVWPKVQAWSIEFFESNPEIVEEISAINMDWDSIMQQVITFLKVGAGTLLGSTVSVAKGIISFVSDFVIAFVFSIYILLQKEKLSKQVKKLLYAFLPERMVEEILSIAKLTHSTFASFLSGQCLEAVILGSMFVIVMTIFRFPYALLIGVLIGFTALIPVVGAFVGCVVGVFLILIENPVQAVGFIILFLVLQQIEGNLIYPHVVGNSVGLPSIWILVAISLGASLMGVVGMLIFIPLLSVIYTLFRRFVYKRLKDRKLLAKV